MAATAPAAEPRSTSQPLIPPDEKFWQRYSPHSEAPLSGVTSAVIHVLAIGLLLLVIWIQFRTGIEEENRSLPVDVVKFGGGGGTPGGKGLDGGRERGKDPGQGSGTSEGQGKGVLTIREKRVLRWAMTFNTRNGKDYLDQLTGLGAKIGIPIEGKEGQFLLVDNLKNP